MGDTCVTRIFAPFITWMKIHLLFMLEILNKHKKVR